MQNRGLRTRLKGSKFENSLFSGVHNLATFYLEISLKTGGWYFLVNFRVLFRFYTSIFSGFLLVSLIFFLKKPKKSKFSLKVVLGSQNS